MREIKTYIRVFPFFSFSLVVGIYDKRRKKMSVPHLIVLEFLLAMTRISLSDSILLVQLYFKNNGSLISTLRAFKKVKNMKITQGAFKASCFKFNLSLEKIRFC